jgi:O-antigen/teichoic acid export membrane protein
MRYFLHFGSRSFLAALLSQALDRIDDLWTGFYLGENALGLYSRAYAFATYPREVLARPVNMIALGTYAELKGNRPILSQAFFRSNALLIRGGFLMAGTLALVAPEFIRLLGDKWLPMLDAFRLMLLFTMLDPIKSTVSKLFAAVGEPERAAKIRLVQLVILVGGLFLLGPNLGITGVAISVNLMLAVGMGLLFWQVRRFVDYSLRQLFLAPGLSLLLGLILTQGALSYFQVSGSDWLVGGSKLIIFLVVYGITLLLMERRQIKMLTNLLKQQIFNKARV